MARLTHPRRLYPDYVAAEQFELRAMSGPVWLRAADMIAK
jgi:hypothetical protein